MTKAVFWRAHGLGNDYLVQEKGPEVTAAWVRSVCDRHRGVGSDGLLEPFSTDRADVGVRIWNPDGSVAEKSGNGIRIFAVWYNERAQGPSSFSVDTGFDVVHCVLNGRWGRVQMGRAVVGGDSQPTEASLEILSQTLLPPSPTIHSVSVGNPHAVMFVEEALDETPWKVWGEAIEAHPTFENRTNVQVARVLNDSEIAIRIWERGAGPTLASGSSSCAVVAAAVQTGRIPPGDVGVRMQGGSLRVAVDASLNLSLEGPVEVVGRIEVDSEWVADRCTS